MSRRLWLVLAVASLAAGWSLGWALDPGQLPTYRVPVAATPATTSPPPTQLVEVITVTVTVTPTARPDPETRVVRVVETVPATTSTATPVSTPSTTPEPPPPTTLAGTTTPLPEGEPDE